VDTAEAARVSTQQAARIWRHSRLDDLVGVYLRARCITLPPPDDLRFHPDLYHRSGGRSPAMVALIRDIKGKPIAVHRTWLTPDGSAKASLDPNKMTLGPMSGGAVRLAPVADTVLLAEGLETTLSATQLTGLPGWSTLHAPGMKAVQLPPSVHVVTIAADHDPPGLEAAQVLCERLEADGRSVTMIRPNREGADFNDVLLEVAW
jgi:putative DNA primase/helicase